MMSRSKWDATGRMELAIDSRWMQQRAWVSPVGRHEAWRGWGRSLPRLIASESSCHAPLMQEPAFQLRLPTWTNDGTNHGQLTAADIFRVTVDGNFASERVPKHCIACLVALYRSLLLGDDAHMQVLVQPRLLAAATHSTSACIPNFALSKQFERTSKTPFAGPSLASKVRTNFKAQSAVNTCG